MIRYRLTDESSIVVLLCALLTQFSQPIYAQNQSVSSGAVGICAAYDLVPEEADYQNTGGHGEFDKYELFFDYRSIRLAANAAHGLHKNRQPDTVLRNNATYLAYRITAFDSRSKLDAYLLGGIALVASTLSEGDSVRYSSDEYGYVLGTGILYYFSEKLGVGCQLLRISAVTALGEETIETGSDQVQLVFKYPFD
jgi:hypothetical protein